MTIEARLERWAKEQDKRVAERERQRVSRTSGSAGSVPVKPGYYWCSTKQRKGIVPWFRGIVRVYENSNEELVVQSMGDRDIAKLTDFRDWSECLGDYSFDKPNKQHEDRG